MTLPGGLDERLVVDVARYVIGTESGSLAAVCRRFGFGRRKGERVLQVLEQHGILGPWSGLRPRKVLVAKLDMRDAIAALPQPPVGTEADELYGDDADQMREQLREQP